jgi:hypothetical protein
VQTIPRRARTSDRVAKFFPVMRSIWALPVVAVRRSPNAQTEWINFGIRLP